MQSGTTGINTTRVYNPIKQAQDHDPKGMFVRRWLPSMRHIPNTWLFEPWKMPVDLQHSVGIKPDSELVTPMVDLAMATRESKQKLHALRNTPQVRLGKEAVIEKHALRRASGLASKAKPSKMNSNPQLGFNF